MSHCRALRIIGIAFACASLLGSALPAAAFAEWPAGVARIAVPTSRVTGPDLYVAAVSAAEQTHPGWSGAQHVVIASGETAALSDAAVASSLCWAYEAPLLLVTKKTVPASTRDALAAIVSANPTATVHVVGSSASIAAACVAQVQSAVGSAIVEQPWKAASRYGIAAGVAQRVREVAAEKGSVVPTVALVANGSDPAQLWDAAVASAVSRNTGIPLLLTGRYSVPSATTAALAAAGNPRVITVGGTTVISKSMFSRLRASERWGGPTRYATAASVANHAIANGFSETATFGVAVTARNAVVGGAMMGASGGVLLFTGLDRLDKATWSFLAPRAGTLSRAYAFGGTSIADAQVAELEGAAAKPWLSSVAPGRYVGKEFRVTGWAGGNTTSIDVYVGDKKVRTFAVAPWARFDVASVRMPASRVRITAIASNPDGAGGKTSRVVKRLKYPAATCIVIDKSDYKLYWVKRNRLVHAYPIAIGRSGMETPAPAKWRILAKYRTSPGSVYGPRKMRLFRQRGNRYVFTAYGIHGTNQPWVIGTKASHGCIRMYNRDVLKLFPQVPMGTMVYTRP